MKGKGQWKGAMSLILSSHWSRFIKNSPLHLPLTLHLKTPTLGMYNILIPPKKFINLEIIPPPIKQTHIKWNAFNKAPFKWNLLKDQLAYTLLNMFEWHICCTYTINVWHVLDAVHVCVAWNLCHIYVWHKIHVIHICLTCFLFVSCVYHVCLA